MARKILREFEIIIMQKGSPLSKKICKVIRNDFREENISFFAKEIKSSNDSLFCAKIGERSTKMLSMPINHHVFVNTYCDTYVSSPFVPRCYVTTSLSALLLLVPGILQIM